MVRTSTGRLDAVVGGNVRRLREARGWRQIDVASRMAGLGHEQWRDATVAMLEGGNRNVRLDELADLCRILGVTVTDLLTTDDPDVTAMTAPIVSTVITPVVDLEQMAATAERQETERRFMATFWRRSLGLGRATDDKIALLDQSARIDYTRSLMDERDHRVDEVISEGARRGQPPTSKQVAGIRATVTAELGGEMNDSETFTDLWDEWVDANG